MTPPAHLVERLRADFLRLTAEPDRIGVAVSGGGDSLALLLLAAAAFPAKVEAATVDHGLREESADEASFVASACAEIGCEHRILNVEVPKGRDGIQGEARRARYAALTAWAEERAIAVLCTAHHAEDQAETLLMRLERGSGVAGLSGVRAVRKEGPVLLVRPVLGWTRSELAEVVAASGLAPVDDPSNRDDRFDRVKMRNFLRRNPEFQPVRLARTASALAEAEDAISWSVRTLASDRITTSGGVWRIEATGLPREIQRRLLNRAVEEVRRSNGLTGGWSSGSDVEGLLTTLEAGCTATRAGVLATAKGPFWTLRVAPPRRG